MYSVDPCIFWHDSNLFSNDDNWSFFFSLLCSLGFNKFRFGGCFPCDLTPETEPTAMTVTHETRDGRWSVDIRLMVTYLPNTLCQRSNVCH